MNNKYTNVYGENIINPNSKQTMTTNTRLAEIEKVLQSGETIIINNKQIKELYNLISTITDVEIELDEEQLDKLITKSWYLEELNISEWNAADIPKMKNLLIGKSIYNSEIRIGKTFTKAEVLTINRLIQNFIRFIEKDNIHLEYVLHNEAEYYTMPYPIGENLIYKFDLVMLKRHDIRKLRYRDMKYGLIVSNFIIDANLDISCEYYQLEFATVLSLGRL